MPGNSGVVLATISTLVLIIIIVTGYFYNTRKFKEIEFELKTDMQNLVSQVNQTGFNKYELDVQQNGILKTNSKNLSVLKQQEAQDIQNLTNQLNSLKFTESEDVQKLAQEFSTLKNFDSNNMNHIYDKINGITSSLTNLGANLATLSNEFSALPDPTGVQQATIITGIQNDIFNMNNTINNSLSFNVSNIQNQLPTFVPLTELQQYYATMQYVQENIPDLASYAQIDYVQSYIETLVGSMSSNVLQLQTELNVSVPSTYSTQNSTNSLISELTQSLNTSINMINGSMSNTLTFLTANYATQADLAAGIANAQITASNGILSLKNLEDSSVQALNGQITAIQTTLASLGSIYLTQPSAASTYATISSIPTPNSLKPSLDQWYAPLTDFTSLKNQVGVLSPAYLNSTLSNYLLETDFQNELLSALGNYTPTSNLNSTVSQLPTFVSLSNAVSSLSNYVYTANFPKLTVSGTTTLNTVNVSGDTTLHSLTTSGSANICDSSGGNCIKTNSNSIIINSSNLSVNGNISGTGFSLHKDSYNNIWIDTMGKFIVNGSIQSRGDIDAYGNDIHCKNIYGTGFNLHQDGYNNIWIDTEGRQFIVNGKIQSRGDIDAYGNDIHCKNIYGTGFDLHKDAYNNIWIETMGQFIVNGALQIRGGVDAYGNIDAHGNDMYCKWSRCDGLRCGGDAYIGRDLHYPGTLYKDSDLRLKNIIGPLQNGLNIINKLSPIKYSLKSDETNSLQFGFIAQEVQKILPNIVKEISSETNELKQHLTLDYVSLVPILIQGMKEQQQIIEAMNTRIKTLETLLLSRE